MFGKSTHVLAKKFNSNFYFFLQNKASTTFSICRKNKILGGKKSDIFTRKALNNPRAVKREFSLYLIETA